MIFLKICHVQKHACQKESANARCMVPDATCMNEPVSLCNITRDSFPNALSLFGHGPLPLPRPEIFFGNLHLVLDAHGGLGEELPY